MPRTSRPAQSRALYDVHPGVVMVQNWIASLPEKTGRTLEEWIQLVKESGPEHRKTFTIEARLLAVSNDEVEFTAKAEGPTKKNAEQDAARKVLEYLDSLPPGDLS